jgi:hypothetical protein
MLAWGKNHINFYIGNPLQFRFEDGIHRSGIQPIVYIIYLDWVKFLVKFIVMNDFSFITFLYHKGF